MLRGSYSKYKIMLRDRLLFNRLTVVSETLMVRVAVSSHHLPASIHNISNTETVWRHHPIKRRSYKQPAEPSASVNNLDMYVALLSASLTLSCFLLTLLDCVIQRNDGRSSHRPEEWL
jgi:hypothetical protein